LHSLNIVDGLAVLILQNIEI